MRAFMDVFCALSLIVTSLLLHGCINLNDEYPPSWPQSRPAVRLGDLQGLYVNEGKMSTPHDDPGLVKLWYFLTREQVSCGGDAVVRITVTEAARLGVQLIEGKSGVIASAALREGLDLTPRNGSVLLPSVTVGGFDPILGGVGVTRCRLHRSESEGLIGELTTRGAGLCLCLVPTAISNSSWIYWERAD